MLQYWMVRECAGEWTVRYGLNGIVHSWHINKRSARRCIARLYAI